MSVVRRPVAARVLVVAVVLVGVVFSVSTIPGVRSGPGFLVAVDGWLQGGGYVLMALLVALRAVLVARDRLLWGLLAGAVAARAVGFGSFLGWVRWQDPQPYPSISDAAWIASALLVLVALLARGSRGPRIVHARGVARLLALDGLVGGLAAAGVGVAVVYPLLVAATSSGAPRAAIAVNLVYPLLDVVALVLVTALVAAGSRARPSDVMLLVGIALSAVVDVLYLIILTEGLWRPGTPVSALTYVGTALIALAAWSSADLQPSPAAEAVGPAPEAMTRSITSPGIAWTAVLAVVCLVGLLVVPLLSATPSLPAVLLLTAGVVAALLRGLLTLREDQRETDALLGSSAVERERFAALVEASDDFIAIADLDGRLVYLNPAGRRLTGIATDEDIRRKVVYDFRPEAEIDRSRQVAMPALRSAGHFESSTLLRHQAGGPPVPVLSHSFVMRSPRTGTAFALGSIQRDVTDISDARDELQRLADERQELLTRLVQVQDEERSRIAADVHDDSVQALAAVQLRLGLLTRQLGGHLDDDQRHSLETVQETVAGATARLRNLLFDLESPARRTDLVTALEEAAAYVLGETGVAWTVEGPRPDGLPEGLRVTAYRVAKEALVNVRKHAGAGHVLVVVDHRADGVVLSVLDDGRGIAADHSESRPGHLGLASMRDRATVAGGRLEVGPRPEGGTRVRLWLPGPTDVAGPAGAPPTS